MAFDPTPTTWIPNWSANATDIAVPIASFPEMTAAEANATTGDIRKIMYAINENMWTHWAAANSSTRPVKMNLSKMSSANVTSGIVTHVYSYTFYNTITGQDVANEA